MMNMNLCNLIGILLPSKPNLFHKLTKVVNNLMKMDVKIEIVMILLTTQPIPSRYRQVKNQDNQHLVNTKAQFLTSNHLLVDILNKIRFSKIAIKGKLVCSLIR